MENVNTNGHQETQQLEFQQAMQDFKTMFPEMDPDVIEEVLRANQGAVDATIDQLLSMTTDNLNEALRLDLERLEEESMRHKSTNSCSNFPDVTKTSIANGSPLKHSKKWCPPLLGPLPFTFLRIQPYNQLYDLSAMWKELLLAIRKFRARQRWSRRERKRRILREKSVADCGEDERIALFLQNEEFLSELRINQDFMSTLEQDVGEKGGGGGPDIEVFKERLRNMGKMSRNKFAQLSKVFQRRKKNRSAKEILDQSASGDSMLLGGEPLLSESLDDSSNHKG